ETKASVIFHWKTKSVKLLDETTTARVVIDGVKNGSYFQTALSVEPTFSAVVALVNTRNSSSSSSINGEEPRQELPDTRAAAERRMAEVNQTIERGEASLRATLREVIEAYAKKMKLARHMNRNLPPPPPPPTSN
ncbi:hypothetical protein MBANPS3_012364, partial [Mucor bainieri]